MKTLCFLSLIAFFTGLARAGAFDELSITMSGPAMADIPVPLAPEAQSDDNSRGSVAACPQTMKGDASRSCIIATQKTTVCADGQKIRTEKVTEKDVKSGKYGRALLGKYKDEALREWAQYQAKLGKDSRWGDSSHQNILATGKVNPIETAYVVLPNRDWLGRTVTVCLKATGTCTEAQALEVGPKTTFRDHSEVSVRTLMNLGLDANPDNGTFSGEITFTFH